MLGALVVAEVALALVLLTGAGLLIRSFIRLQSIDPGFNAEGLFTARVSLPSSRYPDDDDRSRFFTRMLERLEALPGVRARPASRFCHWPDLESAPASTVSTGRHRPTARRHH